MTPYDALGGEAWLLVLTRRFYEVMDSLPEAAACRAIHGDDLGPAREKLFEYLSGWLGGPPLFTDKYGPPMLRRRHFGARIGAEEARGWLACFRLAWQETVDDPALSAQIMPKVEALAMHMINAE
jgi:hemoglobin